MRVLIPNSNCLTLVSLSVRIEHAAHYVYCTSGKEERLWKVLIMHIFEKEKTALFVVQNTNLHCLYTEMFIR